MVCDRFINDKDDVIDIANIIVKPIKKESRDKDFDKETILKEYG